MTGALRESEEMRKRRKIESTALNDDGGRVVQLADDVLTEILMLLPVKSVTRFKSVSKWWLSLISSHDFRHLYQLRKPPPPLILTSSDSYFFLLQNKYSTSDEKPMMLPFGIDGINKAHILSCSNGLILLYKCYVNVNVNEYYVYNPTTKHSQKLPIDPFYFDSPYLAFDPSVSPHYKIVCNRSRLNHHIAVFDSESGAWSQHWKPLGDITHLVQCKNFIYFINASTRLLYCFDINVKTGPSSIVCRLPRRAESQLFSHTLQESNGRLYYSALFVDSFYRLEVIKAACLWELQLDKWVLKHDHTLHIILPGKGKGKGKEKEKGKVCLFEFIAETGTIIVSIHGKLVAYSFHDKSYKELLDLGIQLHSVHLHHLHHFAPTLALTKLLLLQDKY